MLTKSLNQLSRFSLQWLLLALAGVFMLVSLLTISLSRSPQPVDWSGFALWLACAAVGGLLLDRRLPMRDPFLFPLAMFLSAWGLVAAERLAPHFADRQEIWLMLGVASMLLVATFPHALRWLRRYRYLLLAAALLLLLTTIILGSNPSGFATAPRLWLRFGAVYLQPSELMKIILIAFLASYLAEDKTSSLAERIGGTSRFGAPRLLGPMLLMWSLSIIILVWQRDLGTAMLFFVVFVLLLYLRNGDWRVLVGGFCLVLVAGYGAYHLFDVVQLRVDIWLNPWLDPDGRAYQIVQSLIAFGAGGVFGSGPGLGSPYYVPVVHSDFVFAALAEEWGLLGVVAAVSCFAVISVRGLSIAASHSRRANYSLLAAGLTVMLAVQAIMIMAGVLKLLPLTGVTLPFVSYGGSSLLVSFVVIGILLRLSAETSHALESREIRHIGIAILIAFAIVALSAAYWAVLAQGDILSRSDNPRLIDAAARIRRGGIYDRSGNLLVESLSTDAGMTRRYLEPSTYSLVGYYSLRYGASGAEAAFHDILNGSDDLQSIDDFFTRRLLNIPQAGADIQLTVSAELQDMLATALEEFQGAAVVMDAQTGALLALLSQPSFDPNSLDASWDEWIAASGQPFFNRALQGQYQPGTTLLTVWLAEALQANFDLTEKLSAADRGIQISGDVTLGCIRTPAGSELSLREAYTYGCPAPFVDYFATLPAPSLDTVLQGYALADSVFLAGFPAPESSREQPTTDAPETNPVPVAIRDAMGQGSLTITPLRLATLVSAIAGDGSSPTPYVLSSVRDSQSQTWTPASQRSLRRPLIPAAIARELRVAMQQSWVALSAASATEPVAVGAQVARSQSGEERQTWLYGFARRDSQDATAFVVLVETALDLEQVIAIARSLAGKLATAWN